MEKNIKKIEDMSLNAWPSHKMELYDGWILRFSYFYTHRTNSVEQFGNSTLPWREKVAYCEDVYKRLGSPAIFKISPLVSPDFDYTLENRGYEIQHVTEVMTLHLSDARAVVPSMYRAIPKETICASIWKEGKIIATGLGILDRDYIGIYAIHVKENYRGQGFARQICTALLTEGMKKGAENAYLQVVQGNTAAKRLYASLGFTDFYTYWFRVQPEAVTQKGVS